MSVALRAVESALEDTCRKLSSQHVLDAAKVAPLIRELTNSAEILRGDDAKARLEAARDGWRDLLEWATHRDGCNTADGGEYDTCNCGYISFVECFDVLFVGARA